MPRESRCLHYRRACTRARVRFPERWASGKISPSRPARSGKIQERPQGEGEGRAERPDSRTILVSSLSPLGRKDRARPRGNLRRFSSCSRYLVSDVLERRRRQREKERGRDEQVMPYLSPSEFITNGIGVGSRSSERRYMRNRLFRLVSRDRDHYAAVKS